MIGISQLLGRGFWAQGKEGKGGVEALVGEGAFSLKGLVWWEPRGRAEGVRSTMI